MPKVDNATYRRRVVEVMDLLVAGVESKEIIQHAAKNGWNVRDRQIRNYVASAYKDLSGVLDRDVAELRGRHLAQRRHLYRQAMKTTSPDLRAALQILKDEAELLGLYPPTKIAPTNPEGTRGFDGGIVELLPELREAVERLQERAAGRELDGVKAA
jgi:hypothetical protein